MGVGVKVIPMTDNRVQTMVCTPEGEIHFQEYLVKKQAKPPVLGVRIQGLEEARPAPGVIDAILNARVVLLPPSNPVVSIGSILAVPGVRNALRETKAKVIGISPIVGGRPVKGPADKLMSGLGYHVSPYGVARLYRDFLDTWIVDSVDRTWTEPIRSLGLEVVVTGTIMSNLEAKKELARAAISAAGIE